MQTSSIIIRQLISRDATPEEYAALNRHTNRMRKERLPDDPPIPLEETIQNLQSLPPFVDVSIWAGWTPDQTEMVAHGYIVVLRTDDNQHLAQFEVTVLPEHRRQGLGSLLLARIAETAQQENRRLLMTSTIDRIPAGEAFMRRIGAKKGLEAHTNQLKIADLDRELVAAWLRRGEQNLDAFELGLWDGAYPEERLPEVVALYELANQQPFGELEIEDSHLTPEQLRQIEKNNIARGNQRWTFYVIDRQSGRFAGYTETVWNANRPEILRQDMTGVHPEFRGKGLGRWLKAAMLDRVLHERPQVKYVRTGNADTNAAMLKINNELGFKPYLADALWQAELAQVQEYLRSRGG